MTRFRWTLVGIALTASMSVWSVVWIVVSALNHWTVPTLIYSLSAVVNLACLATWIKRRRKLLTPIPPTNVRIVVRGEVIPVDCAYSGFDGRRHEWDVIPPPGLSRDLTVTDLDSVLVDVLPPRTCVSFTMVQLG